MLIVAVPVLFFVVTRYNLVWTQRGPREDPERTQRGPREGVERG